MALLVIEGHMSKLEAVNDILWTIGELPVQSLASGLGDAEIAEAMLDRANREIQLRGWQCNTRRGVTLTTNAGNQFALPVDVLKIDTSHRTSGRMTSSPVFSSHLNAHMRRSQDDTKWLMYDGDNNSETWSDITEMTVDITQLKEFRLLTPALQVYVWTWAAHRFQKGAMGSTVLHEYTLEDVVQAEMQASQEDTENEDLNIIRDNPHVRSVAYRYNPGFNR